MKRDILIPPLKKSSHKPPCKVGGEDQQKNYRRQDDLLVVAKIFNLQHDLVRRKKILVINLIQEALN